MGESNNAQPFTSPLNWLLGAKRPRQRRAILYQFSKGPVFGTVVKVATPVGKVTLRSWAKKTVHKM
jgi:hypothetical protein